MQLSELRGIVEKKNNLSEHRNGSNGELGDSNCDSPQVRLRHSIMTHTFIEGCCYSGQYI